MSTEATPPVYWNVNGGETPSARRADGVSVAPAVGPSHYVTGSMGRSGDKILLAKSGWRIQIPGIQQGSGKKLFFCHEDGVATLRAAMKRADSLYPPPSWCGEIPSWWLSELEQLATARSPADVS